jgi:SagB-type dehydrogenase family enzyme
VSDHELRWRPEPPFVQSGSSILTYDGGPVLLDLDDANSAESLLSRWNQGLTADEGQDWFLDQGPTAMAQWLHLFDVLIDSGRLSPSLDDPDGGSIRLLRHSDDVGTYTAARAPGDDFLVLSPEAVATRRGDIWILECPRGRAVALVSDQVMRAVATLPDSSGEAASARALLREAGILVDPVSPSVDMWESHDRYFHWRSRRGRHPYVVGATYPLRDRMPPLPITEVPAHDLEFDIAAEASQQVDPLAISLGEALHARASTRELAAPLTLKQLANFCMAHRVLSTLHAGGDVEYPQSRRLYPGGGASYELDLVLTTLGVGSLPAGVWWFDPERVVLCRMTSDPAHIDALFADAKISTGGVGRIEVLVSYALRMGRNSWKYEGMAYRLALLDAGVLYGHAYLLAAALGFGVCGLGNGDSSVLARVTEASGDDLVSVAEIMLTGSR